MKKHPILFIYSFLCVSCISFSQLYAARLKFSSLPNSFREALIKDEKNSDFVKTVLERIKKKTHYRWCPVKSTNSFVSLTGVTFEESEQKEAYKTFLKKALQGAKNNLSAQEKLKNVGTVYLVYQGEGLSYYVGGRGGTLRLFTKVSQAEYKQFSVQKQAKRIPLDKESLRKLLSQEFQADNAELQELKNVLFSGENMIKNLNLESIKAGSFFLYSFEKGSENCFNSALNKMFKTIQEEKRVSGPLVIGKTETFEYFLQQKKGKNARLHVKFCDSKKFNNYLKNNNENNPMEVSDHEELESLSHEELESLSHEELLKIREEYIEIIKKDLKINPGRNSSLTRFYTLPDKTAVIYGLKKPEENCTYLSYMIKGSLTAENNKTLICSNKQNGWEYWYLPSSKKQIYIKVSNDVGKIFNQTTKQKVYEGFSQPACKKAISEDIQGNQNNAALLKQVFGMNDTTRELSNIALFRSGNVLRIQLKSTNVERSNPEGLFENPHSLKGKKYTYSLIPSRDGKQKFVKVDGIDDLNALRVHKNEPLVKEEARDDENESSFQDSDDAYVPESVSGHIVKEEVLKEEAGNYIIHCNNYNI